MIRVATPDLDFFARLQTRNIPHLTEEYLSWNTQQCIPEAPFPGTAFVINSAVRDWGHQFIYDRETLKHALLHCGFSDVVECSLQESQHAPFQGLANEGRMPPGLVELETFVLEAVKPS